VQNDETLFNISRALDGEPVTETWLTVCGAVAEPYSACVPVGTPTGELLALAGGFTGAGTGGAGRRVAGWGGSTGVSVAPGPTPDQGDGWIAMEGGAMMGRPVSSGDHPVTKATGGLLFLPRGHRVSRFVLRTEQQQRAVNRAACDQCSYCTQFCPRYLLGYAVEPHRVMRAAGFGARRQADFDLYGRLCCECGICDLYACPEDLSPRDACRATKRRATAADAPAGLPPDGERVHPLREGRLIPLSMLKKRLDLRRYDRPAPYRNDLPIPDTVRLPHRQHVGAAGQPRLAAGQAVTAGQIVAEVDAADLGVSVHAPFAGVVQAVTEQETVIQRTC
jgi:Na+-translocating ferredoxin:NAD+ oxidoreductase RnfC subunit